MKQIALLLCSTILCLSSLAQDDVTTIDGIINAMYDVISGDSGVVRSPERIKNLYHPDAKLIPTVGKDEKTAYYLSLSQYMFSNLHRMEETGFFERELHRVTEQYGQMAHVFSTYETESPRGKKRGINSVQLLNDGNRWWILNVFWQTEDDGHALPEKYLP